MVRPSVPHYPCAPASAIPPAPTQGRRKFLKRLSAASGTIISAGFGGRTVFAGIKSDDPDARLPPKPDQQRRQQAYKIRQQAALYQRNLPQPEHPTNGDDERYPTRIASYSKALAHNSLGEVDAGAYDALLRALRSGATTDFDLVPMGGAVKQINPQACLAFDLVGADSHHLGIPAAPAFGSAEQASEAVELYWQAVTRDVPFADYETHPLAVAAAADLSKLSDFRGPKRTRKVTPTVLFRGPTRGDLIGPYVSQFLWKDVPYAATQFTQMIRTAAPEADYLTNYDEWLAVQNGQAAGPAQIDGTPRYVRNGRDLAEYVHRDFTYQLFLNACLILLGYGPAALDRSNPYKNSPNQHGFSTFGAPHILDMVARAANCALKATWYQKWSLHRRLRPEEFGGRVHNHRLGSARYPLHREALNSPVLEHVLAKHGTYLLPQAYPEGCPTHPAYPAGHAAIAGACSTMLKAFFDESYPVREPAEASADGLTLAPYAGADLTVGNELNKLASNVAIGRDAAGVHWRSDGVEGLKLGETVAIQILADMRECYNERFDGFSLTKFNGQTITI